MIKLYSQHEAKTLVDYLRDFPDGVTWEEVLKVVPNGNAARSILEELFECGDLVMITEKGKKLYMYDPD